MENMDILENEFEGDYIRNKNYSKGTEMSLTVDPNKDKI